MSDMLCPRRAEGPFRYPESDEWKTDRFADHEWPEGHIKPRTCSFCGGVNPDDAIAMMEAGWRVEATDKSYKRYLHAPEAAVGPGRHAQIKLYVQHFDEGQRARFNAALKPFVYPQPSWKTES